VRPAEGVCLGGRYELCSRLAVGGMGEVWLAHDRSLGRSVATKVLRPELAGDVRFFSSLRAEARTAAPLSHPNIAALYDYGEDDDGAGYLVMELVTGESLSDILARERVLDPEVLLAVLAQAARALHAAHAVGVVHRDVKPSNILLTRDGRVKITDFGISVEAGTAETEPRGTVLGTAHYLAPERVLGHPASPASDVYALGVVAYEAAAGRRPFAGDDLVDVANAHVNAPLPELPDHLPVPLADLVRRMLEKRPERRPRSAAAVARTVERVQRELELARPFEDDAADDEPEPSAGARWPDAGTARRVAASLDTLPFLVPRPSDADDRARDAVGVHAERVDGREAGPPAPTVPAARRRPLLEPRPGRIRRSSWVRAAASAAEAITAVLGLAAYRLAGSVTTSRGDAAVLWLDSARTTPTLVGDGRRAAGSSPLHQTEVEDSSW
jgi:serine/threonine protein kinase